MSSASVTLRFLRRQRRRLSGQWLAWSLAATLAALAFGRVDDAGRGWFPLAWQLLAMALAAGLLVHWGRQVQALTPVALARQVDGRHELEALVESVLELRDTDAPLAGALRRTADERLGRLPVGGTRRWLAAWSAAVVAGAACFIVFSSTRPLPAVAADAASANSEVGPTEPGQPGQPATPKSDPAQPPPQIKFAWKSPDRLQRARGAEEVALLLQAEVNRPIQSATLEIELNGTRTYSRPIAAEITRGHPATPAADWPLVLFLDETAGQPYDLVGYFVQATATDGGKVVNGKSRRQLVEILPLTENPRLPASAKAALVQLNALKLTQADLLDDAMELASRDATEAVSFGGTSPAELARRQQALAAETEAAVLAATSLSLEDDAIRALGTLRGETEAARAALAEGRPADALPAQGKILSILAAAERAIAGMAVADSDTPAPKPKPASDAADAARLTSPAGTLEQLAHRQAANNALAPAAASDPAKLAAMAEEQTAIARGIERLAARQALIPPVQRLVESAREPAAEAARQFSLQDLQAGREPAAETEALLQRAVELQEAAGRKAANAVLEQTRTELKNAAQVTDAATQAAQIQRLAEQLKEEIERQQRQGSAEAARQLDALATQIEKAAKPPQSTPAPPGVPAPKGELAKGPGQLGDKEGNLGFVALLRRPGEADDAKPAGKAQVTLDTLTGRATLEVAFERTPGTISEQRIVVVAPALPNVTVAELPPRAIFGQLLQWKVDAGLTPAQITQALKEGQLQLEVATGRPPRVELAGRFVPLVRPGPGPGAGAGRQGPAGVGGGGGVRSGGGGGGPALAQNSRAMPTVTLEGKPVVSDSLLRLSTAAAESQVALAPDQALAQTIRQLKASAAQLAAARQDPAALARLQLAVEKAQLLAASNPQMAAAAGAIAEAAAPGSAGAPNPAALKALLDQVAKLATDLEEAPSATPRAEWLRRFPPEQIDPAYRRPVEDYFETLSREAAPR